MSEKNLDFIMKIFYCKCDSVYLITIKNKPGKYTRNTLTHSLYHVSQETIKIMRISQNKVIIKNSMMSMVSNTES